MTAEKGNVLGHRQQARALARHLEMYTLGVGRHERPQFNEDRRSLRRIALSRARSSWKTVRESMWAGEIKGIVQK